MARECISSIEGAKEQMNRSGAEKREREVEKDGAGVGGGDEHETDDADAAVAAPSTNGAGELDESSWRARAEALSAKNAKLKVSERESIEKERIRNR